MNRSAGTNGILVQLQNGSKYISGIKGKFNHFFQLPSLCIWLFSKMCVNMEIMSSKY